MVRRKMSFFGSKWEGKDGMLALPVLLGRAPRGLPACRAQDLRDGRAKRELRSFLGFLSYHVGWPCPSPLWHRAGGLGSDQGPSVGFAPLFLRLGTRVALCACTMMDKVAALPLLLVVPPLTDASAADLGWRRDLCLNPKFPGKFQARCLSTPLEEKKICCIV